jgi:hypothetical protein
MKKYKYYNNTNGVVQSATRNSITNKVEVVVKVSSGQLGVSTSEVYPITFMAMDDTLFTGFSESCTYNASTDEYTLFFPGTSISGETIAKFMYPSAEWELRVTQTELNELFNEVYQLTGNLVTTPEITGPDAPIVYQGTYANEYSFTASPTLAGNTISSFLVDVSGIGTQVITAADNAGTYTLKIPTTISAGTKLDMYVTATDSQGWKSSPAYKQLTVVAPYVKAPTIVKPTEGQEVIAINFDIQSSTFATEGLEDTCSKTEFQIQNSSGTTVYTKELTGATYTATITDANLQRGVLYRIRCRQIGTTITTPSEWSAFVSFRTADTYIQAPTVISPVTGNQIFKYNVVISGDPFAVVGGETDMHTASQCRVQNVLGTNIYDSGEKTDALTSIIIPELTKAVVGETYKISMRYKGATYGWSDWSTDVTVSIKSAYVNAPVLTAPTQRELAHSYVMGKTLPANNLLQKLADKQGISLDDFAMKVNDKAAAFDECVATAIAKRNMLQEAVKARTGQDLIDLDVSFNPVFDTSEPTEEVLPVEEPTPSMEGEAMPEANAPEGE